MSAIVTVRLRRSNDTLPWLALPPPVADLLERGVDLARDLMLRVKLEAEEAAHRDHDHGDQTDQCLYH